MDESFVKRIVDALEKHSHLLGCLIDRGLKDWPAMEQHYKEGKSIVEELKGDWHKLTGHDDEGHA
jgi:hypothetical protein